MEPSQVRSLASGPVRLKKVISLSFYRTGSQSLKEALTILGYRDVFHSSALFLDHETWRRFADVSDANIACLPSYNGRNFSRADWDACFGPCEALTDVTPFALSLLEAYPEARIILVHRDFDSWAQSFQQTLVLPASGLLAWVSGNWFEPLLGVHLTRTAWKMYMGLLGVCDLRKTQDRQIMRAAYNRHYDTIRRIVPPDRLLEIHLKDLDWEPFCRFLGKDVPDEPFPRLNESKVYRTGFREAHKMFIIGGLLKLLTPVAGAGAILGLSIWLARSKGSLTAVKSVFSLRSGI